MLERFIGLKEEEIKSNIDRLSDSDLTELIKEAQVKSNDFEKESLKINAELQVNQETIANELEKLKELGIKDEVELDKVIKEETESIEAALTSFIKELSAVQGEV